MRNPFTTVALAALLGQAALAPFAQADTSSHSHNQRIIETSKEGWHPAIKMNVRRDPVSGWNLQLLTKDFKFAPENASQTHKPGEGHAHLYIDGKKHARIYSAWYHLNGLSPGSHDLRVTLNANDHSRLSVKGKPVQTSATITKTD